jgi:pyrophosphate--fructose-6-phosphate 1-phosphotransferase
LEITDEVLASYKNQGGYDMLGRTKDQIRTTEQVNGAMASCQALKLDALVIIGGAVFFLFYYDFGTVYICFIKI